MCQTGLGQTRPRNQVIQGVYRTLKVVFHDLPGPFYVHFPGLSRPFVSIYHVFPGLFHREDIEQVRFSYNMEYVTVHNYTKQQIGPSQTVDNDNVCKGHKHVHGSEMWQPVGLFP